VATALGPDDQRFSPIAIGYLTHRLVEVKLLLDQLAAEQKELHDTLRLAHLRGDLLHLLPPGGGGGYRLPSGVQLHRRAGRRQWQYGPAVQELEAPASEHRDKADVAGLELAGHRLGGAQRHQAGLLDGPAPAAEVQGEAS